MKTWWRSAAAVVNKSHFRKMLLLYSCFTLVVIGVSALLLTTYSNKLLADEIELSNSRFLHQVRITSDAHLSNIQSALVERFADSYKDDGISRFFNGAANFDAGTLLQAFHNISGMKSTYSFIDSIYLYRQEDDTLISSREGVVLHASQSDNYNRRYVRFEPVVRLMASTRTYEWTSPLDNHTGRSGDLPVLSLALTAPLYADPEQRIGAIVMNIHAQAFLDSINLYKQGYELMILSPDGKVMAHTDPKKLLQPIESFSFDPLVFSQNEGFATIQGNRQVSGVSWVQSPLNGWKYIAVAPVEAFYKQLTVARNIAISIVSMIGLCAILILALLTSRLNRPIRQFISSATRKYNVQYDNTNEWTFINGIMHNLSARVEEMEGTLLQNQAVIRHKIMFDILLGHHATREEEILERLRVVGTTFPYDRYLIMVTEFNPAEFDHLSPEQREFVIYRTIELVQSVLVRGCKALSVSVNPNRVTTLLNFEERTDIELELIRLHALCIEDLSISCNVAWSESFHFLVEASGIYTQTLNYLKYSFIYGYRTVYSPKRIQSIVANKNFLDKGELDALEPLLKAFKKTQIESCLTRIFDYLQSEPLQLLYVQHVLAQLAAMLGNAVQEHRIGNEELHKDRLLDRLQSMNSLEECRKWMFHVIGLYGEQVSRRIGSIDETFVAKIKSYIVANIDKDLSLTSTAEHFNINPNYLSRIFKMSMGVSFATFVIDRKMRKAQELLLTADKMKIEEIALALGYFNVPYFRAIFKEKFGVSPMQYRKEELNK